MITCSIRSIDKMRISMDWRLAFDERRLLVLSSVPSRQCRQTAKSSGRRNDPVASRATQVSFIHFAPGGKTEFIARQLTAGEKAILAMDSLANTNLLRLGSMCLM